MINEVVYAIRIKGLRPMLMHNGRLANPLDEHTKALKTAAKKRGKTDEDQIEVSRIEFEGGLYHDAKIGPYIPSDNLQAMIVQGARKRKLGKEFEALVDVVDEEPGGFPLQYKGPRDVEGLWAKGFYLFKGVSVGQSTVMRTRPRFPAGWELEFRVGVLDGGATKEQIETAVADAGIYKGLGDWSPRYGRFTVVSVKQL